MRAVTAEAFLFPGQGSQSTDMFEPFYDQWDEARRAFDRIADDELTRLVFEADEKELRKTSNAQQAVFATSLAVSRAFQERFDRSPDIVAGHSLGHLTAATEAGVLDDHDALSLVRERGRLMERAEREAGPGTMFAVLLVDNRDVTEFVAGREEVTVAGYNSPRQTIISGSSEATQQAAEEIGDAYSRGRVTELDVHSGFHSSVMQPAVDPFTAVLSQFSFADPNVPVVSDGDGNVYRRGERARETFSDQLVSPVRWTDVVGELEGEGVQRITVLPPAGEITALTERNTDTIEIAGIDGPGQTHRRANT